MMLKVAPEVDLPTLPSIKVYAVIGFPTVGTSVRKSTENLLFSDCQHSDETF